MFCESYREALSKAALRGERLSAEVQMHVTACAPCRESFSEENALLALLDTAIQARVNAEMPASLLPKVRQNITALPETRSWRVPVLVCAASGLVIGAIGLWFAVRTRVLPVSPEPSPRAISVPVTNELNTAQSESSGQLLVASNPEGRRPRRVAPKPEPEVLVSSEEQIGFQKYTASLRNKGAEAAGVIKVNTAAEIEPLQIASVEVKQLSIQPLESGGSK